MKIIIRLVMAVCIVCASAAQSAEVKSQPPVPPGSPMSESIQFQFALYYSPKPARDPVKVLKKRLASQAVQFRLVNKLPKAADTFLVQARLEKEVQQQYAPPDMDSLKYFGHGISREQAVALQGSQQAMIIDFAYPAEHVWTGLRAATVLLEDLARETNGLLWDEFTREIFSADAWHDKRLKGWHKGVPDISRHTTIHAYKSGEYVRAITLGMAKFGLPDVVISDFVWSSNRVVGNTINLFIQAMAEGARFAKAGEYDLDIRKIRHPAVREPQLESLLPNASAIAKLSLQKGIHEEGDPSNRLIQITFDRYPGRDQHARLNAMMSSLFGSDDSIVNVRHDEELEAASGRARARLPALRAAFNAGLQPGEFIQIKAPFATPAGGREWMWVEVSKWQGNKIEGLLKNEPFNIPDLHGGQVVKVNQQDVFDYIRHYPDGKQEGNETGAIIQKMQNQ